ncbi:MAG: hypothetical protein GY798_08345, partial [Hyphomicrobiales bacterium]|nr:hypothetical protein [Hyphomicrobiales bacterium]
MSTIVNSGSVTVTAASNAVTGTGTSFSTSLVAGGMLLVAGTVAFIASVESDVALTLTKPWPGVTANDTDYEIQRLRADVASVVIANDRLAEIVAKLEAGTFFDPDAVGTLVDRATHDDEAAGFTYVVPATVEGGTPTVYLKLSATSADWSLGQSFQGPAGAGSDGTDGVDGADGTGLVWQGAWLSSTTYAVLDAVENDGSSYVCKLAHTAAAANEPGVGASWSTYWDLSAQAGTDGADGADGTNGTNGTNGTDGTPLIWKGPWLSTTTYAVLDAVENDGSTFVCKLGHTAAAADEPGIGANWSTYWDLSAQAGTDGADGADGINGTNGTDGTDGTSL